MAWQGTGLLSLVLAATAVSCALQGQERDVSESADPGRESGSLAALGSKPEPIELLASGPMLTAPLG